VTEPNELIRTDLPPAPPLPEDLPIERTQSAPTDSDKSQCLFAHIGGFFLTFIPPLIVWTANKRHPFVEEHAREALNFQLTLWIYYTVGCVIFPVVMAYEIYVVVMASLAASRGEPYRIPLNIRFIKPLPPPRPLSPAA